MSVLQSGDIAVDPEGPIGNLATRWRRIAFVAVAATGLALTLAWLSTPQYKGEARLLIDARTSSSADNWAAGENYTNGQIELIRSVDILERVAARLDLARLPEFDEAAQPSITSQALIVVGLKRDPNETPAPDRVLEALREKLRVYGAERSRVIVIQFSSSDPRLAAAIPNAIADAYVSARPDAAQPGLQAAAPVEGLDAELRALEREVERQRELLASSLAVARPAVENNNYVAADARIFARAIAPSEPYFPKFGPIAAVAFVGSLALMTVLTLLGALISGRRRPAMNSARLEPIPSIAMPSAHEEAAFDDQPSDSVFALYDEAPESVAEDVEAIGEEQVAFSEDDLETALSESVEGMSMLGEIGIESAAERLIASGATRAIFVSPEGDEAAAAAVLVAREIADAGLRVLLLDLTASGAASRPMLDSVAYPGITNLMAAEAQFTDVIHSDHYSDCHIMPVGTADPVRAMRAADRLPIIMESLTTAYDVVIVECGPAGAEAIRRLVAPGAEILVSVIEPNEDIAETADALVAGGYGELTLVTPVGYRSPNAPIPGRSAA